MPRRDGLPTNAEMLADFTEIGRQFFNATFAASSEEGLHPGLIDKPLSFVYAVGHHVMDMSTAELPQSFSSEVLKVNLLGEDSVTEPVPRGGSYEEAPADIVAYRTALRRPISRTIVAPDLDIASLVVPGTVEARYTAYDQAGVRKRFTHSFDDRPSKANIAAGKFLGEEMLKYVADRGTETDLSELVQAFLSGKEVRSAALLVQVSADLPLNGHEPRGFLKHFRAVMETSAEASRSRMEGLHAQDAPEEFLDHYRTLYEKKKAAAERARRLLGD